MPAPKGEGQQKALPGATTRKITLDSKGAGKDSIPLNGLVSGPSLTLPPIPCHESISTKPFFSRGDKLDRVLSTENLSPGVTPLTMGELPRVVAQVGTEIALNDLVWMEGLHLMASALGSNIPVKCDMEIQEATVKSPSEKDVTFKDTTGKVKEYVNREDNTQHKQPLTGTEVVEIFAKKKHLGQLQFFHLRALNDSPYRPYDLQVVHPSKAGAEHYIFSPAAVLHITDGVSAAPLSLAEWHREVVLWKALQDIPFFRDYLLRKSFTRWHRNVRKITLQRRCKKLQGLLLMDVPQFRDALFHISRRIEEVKEANWLPQDEFKTYTLLEFQNVLMEKNKECRGLLEDFLHYRALILNTVQDKSYDSFKELQVLVEESKVTQRDQPLHRQLARIRDLKKQLGRSEYVLQQLGNLASLVDQMIVQSLVTITQREVTSFLNNVMKRGKPEQGSLFQTELIFGADGQLTLFPPMHLFQEVVRGALLSVADSALQVFDTCSYSLETNDSLTADSSNTSLSQETATQMSGISAIMSLENTDTEMTGLSCFSSKQEPRVLTTPRVVLPKMACLRVAGQRLRGQYHPLSKKELESQLSLNAWAKDVQREQGRITEDAQLEIQNMCEGHMWLVDIYLLTSQWSPASLEAMRGQASLRYEEHIQKVRFWIDRVRTVPPLLTTTNKFLTVRCSHIQEKIGPLLNSIEEEMLTHLVGDVTMRLDSLASELNKALEGLKTEPTDLNEFTHYASMVKRLEKHSVDMQHQLEYVHSLQDTICLSYRKMTPQETIVEEQMLDLWDTFITLLKRAEETVSQRLPSMADTLDITFLSLANDLEELVSNATSGPFLDPTQNAGEMVARLSAVCRQVYVVTAKMKEHSKTSRSLRGNPLDLTFVSTAMQKIEAHKGLWELMSITTAQIQEWRQLLFSKFVVSRAQEKVNDWLKQLASLARIIPSDDAVLQETLQTLERFNLQLPVLIKLSSPSLKRKHWRNIFKGMGLLYAPEWNLTVADLMSKRLREHQLMISKICRESKAESDMEQAFLKLQRSWEGALFRLAKFITTVRQEEKPSHGATRRKLPSSGFASSHQTAKQQSLDSGTFTIIGLETLIAQTEDSVMTLSNMLLSPHVSEFRQEVESWVQLLQELEELLDFFERYQQKWVFISKMFRETSVRGQKAELSERFHPVDKTFRDLIQETLNDPRVLNIVRLKKIGSASDYLFHGQSLRVLLTDGLLTMDCISNQLLHLIDSPREEFPRLCFLNDGEVIKLLSLHPTISTLLPLVRKCFRGVQWLEIENNSDHFQDVTDLSSGLDPSDVQMWVRGVFGSCREHVSFLSPLEPNLSPLVWLSLFEQQLQKAMLHLMKRCAVAHQQFEPMESDLEHNTEVREIVNPDIYRFSNPPSSLRQQEGPEAKGGSNLTSIWELLAYYPLQCILVAEEAVWCCGIQKAAPSLKWSGLKAQNTIKLQNLCQAIRDGISGVIDKSLFTNRIVMILRALVLLTMKHTQQLSKLMVVKGDLQSSFEWQSLMKYHLNPDSKVQDRNDSNEHSCYVEIFGNQLPYGYEYLGPEHWTMVNTPSTERATLGILLALTSYRCGFVSGPHMSGKTKTVVELGRALGQQVVSLRCCENTSPMVVQQMLSGALQTGAWLVLDSVDLMTQGTLSLLGQHLADIQQSLSALKRDMRPKSEESPQCHPVSPRHSNTDMMVGCKKPEEPDSRISFAGKSLFAKLNYGCVIISSKGYSNVFPENLRVATRPIALTHPDYRLITEVTLTSLGFSESLSLSRRLLSLFTIAKECLCLPDSIREQTSWLVLLRNVIAVSGSNLQSTCRQEVIDKEKVSGEDPDTPKVSTPVDEILKQSETEEGDKSSNYKRSNQSAAIIQGVVEEKAVVKGVLSVLLSAISDQRKLTQFRTIFEETFPIARTFTFIQQHIEEGEQNILKNALIEELQQTGFHADTQVLRNIINLFQAMKLSRAVILVGPSGCGKTTCYRALAGALRNLEARAVENESNEDAPSDGDGSDTDQQSTTSNWSSVDTVVIFPNTLSYEELFGGSSVQQTSWRDGAFTKVLRDSERHELSSTATPSRQRKKGQPRKSKWLVLDGEPLGKPGWLDPFSTLCNPEDMSLSLPSGEKVLPSRNELKLLAEITDLRHASPSAVTRCNLVYLTGTDIWKSVWKVEMDALYREHSLDQGILTMWNRLAEDLFSVTLEFLRSKSLNPLMQSEVDGANKPSQEAAYGLQEVTSCIRILHALLELHVKTRGLKSRQADKKDLTAEDSQSPSTGGLVSFNQPDYLIRNMFLVAYIWGFGRHLHPRNWPQFDLLAREALFESRYKVKVPDEGTVFDHFFNMNENAVVDTNVSNNSSRSKSPQLTYTVVPQYEKYSYLLELMLEARLPALLIGEAGSGKTKLCQSLLTQDRPHVKLPASPRLCASHLRKVLEGMGFSKARPSAMVAPGKQPPGMVLFVDDLHEAPCDAFGKTSMALEILRQCISKGGVPTSDGYHFKLFSSGAITFLGTCRTSTLGNHYCNNISARLGRLFSIFVLPSLSVDVLFSIHSPRIKHWLKEFSNMPKYGDIARCVISATVDLYQTVCDKFQPSVHRPLFIFSHHDLQKVFQGMYLWTPRNSNRQPLQKKVSLRAVLSSSAQTTLGPVASILNIARLWMHECLRTFGDRMCSEDESDTLVSLIAQVSESHFSSRLTDKFSDEDTPTTNSPTGCSPPIVPESSMSCQSPISPGQREDSEALPSKQATKTPLSSSPTQEQESLVLSNGPDSSDSRASGSEEELFGEMYPPKDKYKRKKKVFVKKAFRKEKVSAQKAASLYQGLSPSPPKGPKPGGQPERKRVSKLIEQQSPQNETSYLSEQIFANPLGLVSEQLLQDMEAKMQHVVYSPELLEPLSSMAQQHNFKRNSSYQVRDLELLVQQLVVMVKKKEEEEEQEFCDNYSTMSSYIVHKQRVCQLLHILRALLIPGGHGVLFGSVKSTGRKTTVRLAAHLTGYQLFEVHPGNESKLREMLKEVGVQAGVHGGNVIMLAHQEVSHAVRDELLVVMASGTFPGLYSDEELKNLVLKINALIKNSRIRLREDQALEKYFRQILRNVHVFLLLPTGNIIVPDNTSVTLSHTIKALSLCCCVEVYTLWSNQSLVEAAARRLKENMHTNVKNKLEREGLVASIAQAMAGIHQSAWMYASELLPDLQPFSPRTYVELIVHFFHLCQHLCDQGVGEANRVATILGRITDMTNEAEQHSQEVLTLKKRFAETQRCERLLQRKSDTERTLCERARQHCLLEESKLSCLEEQFQEAQQLAADTFKEISPLYQAAVKALHSLNPKEVEEVRHYRVPPDGVVMVMDAICLLFNCPCNWESHKQLLGQPNFCEELEFFDRTKMSDDLYDQLGNVVRQRRFNPEYMRGVSRACESLCSWVHSVYQYATLQRQMAPQLAKKKHLGLRMSESRGRLCVARLEEEEVRSRLEDLEKQQQEVRQKLEDLKTQLSKAKTLKAEADAAVKQVSRHIAQWNSAAKETEMISQTITGDALILSAIITYLGPFWPDMRVELRKKWRQLCDTGRIHIYPEDSKTAFETDTVPMQRDSPPFHIPIPIGAELQTALARAVGLDPRWVEGVPSSLVLKLLLWGVSNRWVQHWPLLADAQQHLKISTRPTQLTGKNKVSQREGVYGMVVSADNPELMSKLGKASGKGLKVLVTHVERAIPTPQFLAMLVRPAGSRCPGFRRPVPVAHPDFCLFLSSPLSVRLLLKEVHPSILAEVRVIDLSLSAADVQDLLLTELVQSVSPELWNQHCLVKTSKQSLQDKLCQEEVSLTEYILQSLTRLLQDPEFLPRVSACQLASQSIQVEIKGLMLELERHKVLMADFQRVAKLATSLYQALQEVERLSPIYFFPLRNFLFAVRGALATKGRTDFSCSGEVATGAVMAEITHRMIAHLLAQYRPCLFESHATLLRLLVAVALLRHHEPCSELERVAFLRGLGEVGSPARAFKCGASPPPASPSHTSQHALPSWVPLQIQEEVLRLEKIPAFKGLITSLNTYPRQWQEYLRFPSSTLVGPVPCRSHSHLSTMQRALLWKTMVPHWLSTVAEDMCACHLGQPLRSAVVGAPHTGSPEALCQFLSKRDRPVIITLPDQGREAWASIQPLHLIKQVAQYQSDMKEVYVKIISFGEVFHKEMIMSVLEKASQGGHWLVFNNCHLLKEWNKEVLNKINQLISGPRGYYSDVESEEGQIPAFSGPCSLKHPRFKLWFITRGYTPHLIPAAVRVSASRLVCDSPWDLKEELFSNLSQVVSVAQAESTPGITASNMIPILRCAILHSVLLQRQTYKYLGQGAVYYWTQEDLLALVDAQLNIVKNCEDQTEALVSLAATIIYGGHVADSADLEAVECITKACLRPSPCHWGSGPHTLSDIFQIHGHFDASGLLQDLEHRVCALPNTNDPLVLGFSAGLTEELVKIKSHTLKILLHNSQETTGFVRSLGSLQNYKAVLPELNQARDRLQNLRDSLGRKEDSRLMSVGTASLGPLRNFLQAEWDGLADMVSSLISDLKQVTQNSKLNIKSSLSNLSNLSRLERRAELLRAYLWDRDNNGAPGSYQLSAFDNARGFLAAIMREAAQAKQRDISNVSLCFQVLGVATSPASPPLSGVYLSGLELRGALWDTRLGALQDTLSPKSCLLPVLWVKARIGNTGTARNIDSPPFHVTLPIYNCPLYLDHVEHENGDWGLAEANIITQVPLVAKLDPVLCTLRRVRLVSTL